mmetsp:Transcript_135823/g.378523  ORF Transcript_135823/g.378523 Transcript_135823/m.378523 type:complete len:308 (+) Transcript_135823:43-966(+)
MPKAGRGRAADEASLTTHSSILARQPTSPQPQDHKTRQTQHRCTPCRRWQCASPLRPRWGAVSTCRGSHRPAFSWLRSTYPPALTATLAGPIHRARLCTGCSSPRRPQQPRSAPRSSSPASCPPGSNRPLDIPEVPEIPWASRGRHCARRLTQRCQTSTCSPRTRTNRLHGPLCGSSGNTGPGSPPSRPSPTPQLPCCLHPASERRVPRPTSPHRGPCRRNPRTLGGCTPSHPPLFSSPGRGSGQTLSRCTASRPGPRAAPPAPSAARGARRPPRRRRRAARRTSPGRPSSSRPRWGSCAPTCAHQL